MADIAPPIAPRIAIDAALGSGFSLIRRRPLMVLAWGLAHAIFTAGSFVLLAPFYLSLFSRATQAAQSGAAPTVDLPAMMQMQGLILLLNLAGVLVQAILYCAVFRAVLHPEQGRFAFLRCGAAELFVFLVNVVALIVFFVGTFLLILPGGIIVGVLAATHADAAATIVAVVVIVVILVGVIYLALRFSLVGPMIVDDGRFHLLESWAMTRGQVGSLLAIGLCLVAILLVAEIVLGVAFLGIGAGILGAMAGGWQNLQAFFNQPPETILVRLWPLLVLMAVVWIPLSGCFLAIVGAPWARVYRDLVGGDPAGTPA